MSTTVKVTYERDPSGAWLVRLTDNERAHTFGRSVQAARRAIRDVIHLWLDLEPDDYVLEETFAVGPEADVARRARAAAEDAQNEANHALKQAATMLNKEGVSLRDAAEILGVSFQRVHQLVH